MEKSLRMYERETAYFMKYFIIIEHYIETIHGEVTLRSNTKNFSRLHYKIHQQLHYNGSNQLVTICSSTFYSLALYTNTQVCTFIPLFSYMVGYSWDCEPCKVAQNIEKKLDQPNQENEGV